METIPDGEVVNGDDSDNDSNGYTENSIVTIFGRSVNTIDSNKEEFVNTWITQHTTGSRLVVGLHLEVLDDVSRYQPSIPTISVCVNGECLIYQMFSATCLPIRLKQLITDPNNTIVGVNLERKLRALNNRFLYDFQIPYRNLGSLAARRFQRVELLHADMCELSLAVLGRNLVMQPVNPDWNRRMLLLEQVLHASVTAYVSYELGRALLN